MDSEQRQKQLRTAIDHHVLRSYDGITHEFPGKLFKVFEPFSPIKQGTSESKKRKKKPRRRVTGPPSDDSVRRTKTKIRTFILANQFDLFVTFTFNRDRQDIAKCIQKMHNWLKNWQKRHPKCKYLAVHEFHKDGVSLHFHVLFKNFTGTLKEAINPRTGKPVTKHGMQVYSVPGFRLGFTNAQRLDDSPQSRTKLAKYVAKYLTKEIPEFFNKKRYWRSLNLDIPTRTYGLPEWYREREPVWTKELEFGRLSYFAEGQQSKERGD